MPCRIKIRPTVDQPRLTEVDIQYAAGLLIYWHPVCGDFYVRCRRVRRRLEVRPLVTAGCFLVKLLNHEIPDNKKHLTCLIPHPKSSKTLKCEFARYVHGT